MITISKTQLPKDERRVQTEQEVIVRPRGYKTFSMLNSTEHDISTAHKN